MSSSTGSRSSSGSFLRTELKHGASSDILFWVDRQGVARPLTETRRNYIPHPRLSPDGRRLAVGVRDAHGGRNIWLHELDRGSWTRLTFEGSNEKPIWSPDGKQIVFTSDRVGGVQQIFSKSVDGSGQVEQLTEGAYHAPTSLSPDGKSVVFRERGDDGSWDIGMLRLDGERNPEILLATPFDEHNGMVSLDGRWLAYVSNESGRDEIYVTPFPDSEGKWPISTEGGTELMWSPDGKELFYRSGDEMMAVAISTEPDFTPGKPTILFKGDYVVTGATTSSYYDVTSDGRQFMMVGRQESSELIQLNVVLNWFEELKRLAPTN